jgi:hypothetical protein
MTITFQSLEYLAVILSVLNFEFRSLIFFEICILVLEIFMIFKKAVIFYQTITCLNYAPLYKDQRRG